MDFDVDVTRLDFYIDTLTRSARLHVRSRIFCVTEDNKCITLVPAVWLVI